MKGPEQPKPKITPPTLLELQYVIECRLDDRMAVREIMQHSNAQSDNLDREIRCLELLCEMAYTVSLEKERYKDLVIDVRAKHGRWVHPDDRANKVEPEATEE